MTNENNERQTLIRSMRREIRWGTPFMAPATLVFLWAALGLEGTLMGRLGALLLAAVMAYATYVGVRRWNASDAALLKYAETPMLWPLVPMGIGMVLMSAGQDTGSVVILGAVVFCSIQEMMSRRNLAMSLRSCDSEKMSLAA